MKIFVKKYRWKDEYTNVYNPDGSLWFVHYYPKGYAFNFINYRGLNKELVSTSIWFYKILIKIHWKL